MTHILVSQYVLTILATGKKARFEPIESWRDLEVYGIRSLETIKLIFGFCQESNGRYFGEETKVKTAASLKEMASEARGKNAQLRNLSVLEDFFGAQFAITRSSDLSIPS